MSGGRRIAALSAALTGLFAAASIAPQPAGAKVFLTRSEALELAFPDCKVDRQTRYLTADQRRRATEMAGVEVDSRLVVQYAAHCESEPAGTAYFDIHRVRTLAETLMVVVDAEGRVVRLEVMSFLEPEEYIPRRNWYEQFLERRLDDRLRLKRSIHAVTGATLTARATTEAVRRILALDQVLREATVEGGVLVP
ncbi:MAG: FMN-binding protein [Acidobacteria bacterium]|nr:FMN-binding protein [Acidobacteriota bacterium]